jgi:subtilisin family serine protease
LCYHIIWTNYYWFQKKNNENIDFEVSKKSIYIEDTNNTGKLNQEKVITSGKDFKIIETTEKEYDDKVKKIKTENTIVQPVLIYKDGTKQICRNEIIIKIYSNESLEAILKGIDFSATKNTFVANQYLVKIKNYDTTKVFDLINSLTNDKRIDFIEPNFLILNAVNTADPYYASQYSINNNGYLGGTVDADMDVDEAWEYSTGAGIKVAILDVGVDLTHPDLQANLLPGYDAINNIAGGGYVGASYHGTACAGIVGAVGNNNIGTVGVAYNSKIIPVRVGSGNGLSYDVAANGINWAWQNGADILSNSWGGGSPSTSLTNAINSAITSGRNGKGCVVLFATGNCNIGVSYPASLPNVIAVGASNQCDQRKSPNSCDGETWSMSDCSIGGSNYGANLDVVAPGVKIYTTDVSGIAGYSTDDYIATFNGTSAACPNAAGVMALILSLKPSLTNTEARQILESSTDKVAGYTYGSGVSGQSNGTWNNEVGYGRINALKAVKAVYPYKLKGAIPVCYQSSMSYVFLDPTPPAGSTIIWESSPELIILNSPIPPTNSAQIFVKSNLINNNYNSNAYLLVTVNGVQQKLRIALGPKPFSYNVINTPANISSDYCDASFHYTSIDVVNSDKEGSYSYSFSMLSTATNTNPNLPITYTQISGAETGTSRFLFKIPRSKISVTGPALIYAITINSPCASSPMVSYNNAINIKPCYSGGTTYRMSKNKEENSFKEESSFEDNMVYSVYPNPTKNLLFISLGDQAPKELINSYAILYDVLGVDRKHIQIETNMVYIDTSDLAKGIYILNVSLEGEIKTHKIVVE